MGTERGSERYRRQLPLLGENGQEKLSESEIFIAGAGGLGCPVAVYLAVAGVGTITIADNDIVETTNLNRQILHGDADIGKKKVVSAAEKLRRINPEITVNAIDAFIGKDTIGRLAGNADGIVDALDNFPARYLLNETALSRGIPLFHGAVRGLHGQATTIVPGSSPCLACIFPEAPPAEEIPVLGATAGFIAMVQATETIKYLVGDGALLAGRLLVWDGRESRCEELMVGKDPACPACGSRAGTGTGRTTG